MLAASLSAWSLGNSKKWQLAFPQLLEAAFYAHDCRQTPWQFAIEIDFLFAAGLTVSAS